MVRFYFFKQKTAYEMRISDWSADVCSSDLPKPRCPERRGRSADRGARACARLGRRVRHARPARSGEMGVRHRLEQTGLVQRSEEHTSELQSLMRISYAVFCLKKKNKTNTQIQTTHTSPHKQNRLHTISQ